MIARALALSNLRPHALHVDADRQFRSTPSDPARPRWREPDAPDAPRSTARPRRRGHDRLLEERRDAHPEPHDAHDVRPEYEPVRHQQRLLAGPAACAGDPDSG